MPESYLLALEGGGSHSQAAVMDNDGRLLHVSSAAEVNTNFVSYADAQEAVWQAVSKTLEAAQVPGEQVRYLVSALVGPRFGPELFGGLIPNARYVYYGEQDVIFARAGIYELHGVAVTAATGCTAWGIRSDDGRRVTLGGWGSLLGDEGSGYAAGLLGLRAAVRAFEGREAPTGLVEEICRHFGIKRENFHHDLIRIAYQKPLSRAEIAALSVPVIQLARSGDAVAVRIVRKVAGDISALVLHTAARLFAPEERFPVAAAGGLFKAGPMILEPLEEALRREFPNAWLALGTEEPAPALGRLALDDQKNNRRKDAY